MPTRIPVICPEYRRLSVNVNAISLPFLVPHQTGNDISSPWPSLPILRKTRLLPISSSKCSYIKFQILFWYLAQDYCWPHISLQGTELTFFLLFAFSETSLFMEASDDSSIIRSQLFRNSKVVLHRHSTHIFKSHIWCTCSLRYKRIQWKYGFYMYLCCTHTLQFYLQIRISCFRSSDVAFYGRTLGK